MANDDMDRVVPLDQLDDFKVACGEPDVRGWEVHAADGRRIGEVDELLVDTAAMKVRYLDVGVDDGLIAGERDRHVLVPIGYARLERDHDCVVVEQLSSTDLRGIPAYDHGPITRDFEASVRDSYRGGRAPDGPSADGDFYADREFAESRFWAARRSTGLGGALGDIGADAGMPHDIEQEREMR